MTRPAETTLWLIGAGKYGGHVHRDVPVLLHFSG